MARRSKYTIPTLFAAGLTPFAAVAGEEPQDAAEGKDTFFDSVKKMVSSIGDSHQFTLAQHRSHQSHGSHVSHQSHRSYGYRLTPEDTATVMQAAAGARNEMSTPHSSVLPSSPAIAGKLKVLPGNSEKFRELVMRMQVALQVRGYEVGAVNGEIHARTVAALYRYQEDAGFVPSGKVTSDTLSSLGITAQ